MEGERGKGIAARERRERKAGAAWQKASLTLLRADVNFPRMKTDKGHTVPRDAAEEKTTGMKMVEKYRPRVSRLTDAERQKLMIRGMQIIYGEAAEAKPTHRR